MDEVVPSFELGLQIGECFIDLTIKLVLSELVLDILAVELPEHGIESFLGLEFELQLLYALNGLELLLPEGFVPVV